jgi:hypothetical protein
MLNLLALLLTTVMAGKEVIPTQPGTSWKFQRTIEGQVIEEEWQVAELPEDFKGRLLGEYTDIGEVRDQLTAIRIDGEIRFLISKGSNEFRIYRRYRGWGDGNYFEICWVIPNDLQDGLTWTGGRVHFSCGILVFRVDYRAARKNLTLPAGEFNAFEISSRTQDGWSPVLWVVPGVGIVKIGDSELTSWGVSKKAKQAENAPNPRKDSAGEAPLKKADHPFGPVSPQR